MGPLWEAWACLNLISIIKAELRSIIPSVPICHRGSGSPGPHWDHRPKTRNVLGSGSQHPKNSWDPLGCTEKHTGSQVIPDDFYYQKSVLFGAQWVTQSDSGLSRVTFFCSMASITAL